TDTERVRRTMKRQRSQETSLALRLGGNLTDEPSLDNDYYLPTWHDSTTFPDHPIDFAAQNLRLLPHGQAHDIFWPLNDIRGIRTEISKGQIREAMKLHWQTTWVPLTAIHPEDRRLYGWEDLQADSLMPHHLGMREFEWFDVVQKFDIK